MAPNNVEEVLDNEGNAVQFEKLIAPQAAPRNYQIIYKNLIIFGGLHLGALYGLYLCFTSAKWATIGFAFVLFTIALIGVTAGAHRLWAHRSYKAKMPLQILLMVMNSVAYHNSALHWVRDHRLHHKYSDTDADPHNATRGFFYSHVGWLLVKKHSEVIKRGKFVDMSDMYSNPVLVFQKRYAIPFISTVCFLLPTVIPWYFWGESLSTAWFINMHRYVTTLNIAFLVNSAGHLFGKKPYDTGIMPVQNVIVSLLTGGEGYHNYHHVYPWDYKASESRNNVLNPTTKFIDFFAMIGWAYDLNSVPQEIVNSRASRTGDGTNLWGWGDKKMTNEQKNNTEVIYRKTE